MSYSYTEVSRRTQRIKNRHELTQINSNLRARNFSGKEQKDYSPQRTQRRDFSGLENKSAPTNCHKFAQMRMTKLEDYLYVPKLEGSMLTLRVWEGLLEYINTFPRWSMGTRGINKYRYYIIL